MSILDRFYNKNGQQTSIGREVSVKGDLGIWVQYLKLNCLSECKVRQIEFHLCDPQLFNQIVKERFNCAESCNQGYVTSIDLDRIDIFSQTEIGLIFAVQNLLSHVIDGLVDCGDIYNYPIGSFRGLKAFLPARENIPYFFKLIDFCLAYGINTIILEVGGAMEYISHPEINQGWIEYCKKFMDYPGQSVEYQFSMDIPKNSIHWENAKGGVLSRQEVRQLVAYCRQRGMNVIPEMPTLSHSDYLLYNHRDLAERPCDPTPDAYCPSNPACFKLVCDLLDEVIEVFSPSIIHMGHDELYTVAVCEKCRTKDPARLFADDINGYNAYLKAKGIQTMIWGDKLLNAKGRAGHEWGGAEQNARRADGAIKYHVPATYESMDMIDDDIMIMHWYWSIDRDFDSLIADRFYTVYGNFKGIELLDCQNLKSNKIDGFCTSNWAECKELLLQRNGVFFHLAYNSMMCWNGNFNNKNFKMNIEAVADDIFYYYNRDTLSNSYIEIIHTTENFLPHEEFVDGYYADIAGDYLGSYHLEFENGEKMEIPVQYGKNIGYCDVDFSYKESHMYYSNVFHSQLFETTLTCRYAVIDGKMYYRSVYPTAALCNIKHCCFAAKNAETKVLTHCVQIVNKEEKKEVC